MGPPPAQVLAPNRVLWPLSGPPGAAPFGVVGSRPVVVAARPVVALVRLAVAARVADASVVLDALWPGPAVRVRAVFVPFGIDRVAV